MFPCFRNVSRRRVVQQEYLRSENEYSSSSQPRCADVAISNIIVSTRIMSGAHSTRSLRNIHIFDCAYLHSGSLALLKTCRQEERRGEKRVVSRILWSTFKRNSETKSNSTRNPVTFCTRRKRKTEEEKEKSTIFPDSTRNYVVLNSLIILPGLFVH